MHGKSKHGNLRAEIGRKRTYSCSTKLNTSIFIWNFKELHHCNISSTSCKVWLTVVKCCVAFREVLEGVARVYQMVYNTCAGIDRDPGFNPVSRDPEPFYPDPDPSRFEFKIPDFSGFYRNFKISNLHSLHTVKHQFVTPLIRRKFSKSRRN